MIITIFGSSTTLPDTPDYQNTLKLGKYIADLGHTVMNGGYLGTMEAVSRGAAEAGGKVIGITCDEIEKWRPVKPNSWLTDEVRFPTLQQRLDYLVCQCDLAIALPGGIGTLTEIAYTWNLMVIGVLTISPLWVVGSQWRSVIEAFYHQLTPNIPSPKKEHIYFHNNIDEVIGHFDKLLDYRKNKIIHDKREKKL